MVNYYNKEVCTEKEIDMITTERIGCLFGSIEEELKWHRKAMFAFIVMIKPEDFGESERKKAIVIMEKLEKLYIEIETIIEEGKKAKDLLAKENTITLRGAQEVING